MLQQLTEAEATEFIAGARPHVRIESRTNRRDGDRAKVLPTAPAMFLEEMLLASRPGTPTDGDDHDNVGLHHAAEGDLKSVG